MTRTLGHFFIANCLLGASGPARNSEGNGHADDRTHLSTENSARCTACYGVFATPYVAGVAVQAVGCSTDALSGWVLVDQR
jgi:hypothetical protein